MLLRERVGECPWEVCEQIDKDVPRTYAPNVLVKTKIAVSQSGLGGDKFNLVETLRVVLRLYAVLDGEVGYVQGMNMVCGAVALHMREIGSCFVFFKEVMIYGKLRELYLHDFALANEELRRLFHDHLRLLDNHLYSYLVGLG
jgi:hypothetical protein